MRYAISLLLLVATVFLFASPNFAQNLPFQGSHNITNGPGEGFHTGRSSEAIDYAGSFTVYAPADGYILDVQNVVDFGFVVRITHSNAYGQSAVTSFYAHMKASSVQKWKPGDFVAAGTVVGTSYDTGTGAAAGKHLHFEARVNAVKGSGDKVYSGQSIPIRALPGQWWYQYYSPIPDFHSDANQPSGVAEYPLSNKPPSKNMRHLANFESPSGTPAGYLSNVTNKSVWFHMGGSPSTPNNNQYRTDFQIEYYSANSKKWIAEFGSYTSNSTYLQSFIPDNSCFNQNQRCDRVWSYNTLRGWSNPPLRMYFHPGDSNTRQPYLIFSYKPGSNTAVLYYDSAGATLFRVWEDPINGDPVLIYNGSAKTLGVSYQADTRYNVAAWSPSKGWTPSSVWLFTTDAIPN